jgi:uncharacterized membrane protein
VVLRFEIRALHLLGRCSTAWAAPFSLIILEISLAFCLGWPGPWFSYFCFLPSLGWQVSGMTPSFFPLKWDLVNFFAQSGLEQWSSQSQPSMYLGMSAHSWPGTCKKSYAYNYIQGQQQW